MRPDDVLAMGPLVLALDRAVALVAILVFLSAMEAITRRRGGGGASLGWFALLAGLLGARAGYVVMHWPSFALDPIEILRVWLGGWHWPSGVAAVLGVLAFRLGRSRSLLWAGSVLAVLTLAWWGFEAGRADRPRLRLPADLQLVRMDGTALRLADYRGGPLIINLWATWCPPCRRETPMLARVAAGPGPLPILLVNQGEDQGTVARYLASEGLPAKSIVLDTNGVLGTVTASKALPTTLLVGRDGTIVDAWMGEVSRVQLDILARRAAR